MLAPHLLRTIFFSSQPRELRKRRATTAARAANPREQTPLHQLHAQPRRLRTGLRNATGHRTTRPATQRRQRGMNRVEAASPPPFPLEPRRARLRGRPSGLKGRYRDRYATDLRPALDPGASTAPNRAGARAGPAAMPAQRRGAQPKIPTIKSLRFQGISTRVRFGLPDSCLRVTAGGEPGLMLPG